MKSLIAGMKPLIECVANFSEGRDPRRIEALVSATGSVPGADVLDVHSDPDHNRSVVTLAGRPEAVAEAALRGVGKAAEIIDLTRHAGVHPRIGAADVVPFVPIGQSLASVEEERASTSAKEERVSTSLEAESWSLEECAALAHGVGSEIWERFRVPVYLYGAAAMRPERAALETIRRGQFEGLRDAALLFPDRAPDIGGPALHPTAGAVAVGARNLLIACNVNLQTADLSIAVKIARTIRSSSGGLPGVKAIGLPLESRGFTQVSINLTDFRQTSLACLFDAVRREAARYGCTVAEEEIVGLVPRQALESGGDARAPGVLPSRILENRLGEMLPLPGPGDMPSNGALFESILMKDRYETRF